MEATAPPQYNPVVHVQPGAEKPGNEYVGQPSGMGYDAQPTGVGYVAQPPGMGYAAQPPGMGYAAQPQAGVMVVQQRQPPPPSMTAAFITSCVVFWCCNWLFGAIAFFVALSGSSDRDAGDYEGARKKSKIAIVLSIVGVLVSLIIVIIFCIQLYAIGKP